MPRDLTWWTGASQMQAQRSRQSLLRWTRRRRRRCTSSSAPPHDGSQGNRRSRLFRPSPERGFFNRIIQIKTRFADYLHCVTSRLHLAREPAGKMSLWRNFLDTSFFDNSLSTNGIIVDIFFLYSGFVLSRQVYFLCCLWRFLLLSILYFMCVSCIMCVAIKKDRN